MVPSIISFLQFIILHRVPVIKSEASGPAAIIIITRISNSLQKNINKHTGNNDNTNTTNYNIIIIIKGKYISSYLKLNGIYISSNILSIIREIIIKYLINRLKLFVKYIIIYL